MARWVKKDIGKGVNKLFTSKEKWDLVSGLPTDAVIATGIDGKRLPYIVASYHLHGRHDDGTEIYCADQYYAIRVPTEPEQRYIDERGIGKGKR